jgi:hypothetical protein
MVAQGLVGGLHSQVGQPFASFLYPSAHWMAGQARLLSQVGGAGGGGGGSPGSWTHPSAHPQVPSVRLKQPAILGAEHTGRSALAH